jgi:hypothetical protein
MLYTESIGNVLNLASVNGNHLRASIETEMHAVLPSLRTVAGTDSPGCETAENHPPTPCYDGAWTPG